MRRFFVNIDKRKPLTDITLKIRLSKWLNNTNISHKIFTSIITNHNTVTTRTDSIQLMAEIENLLIDPLKD